MRLPRMRFTVRRLMAVVAVFGLLLGAWVYRIENASIDRALTAMQLRDFAGGDASHRRMAIEDLAHAGPDDRVRVFPAEADKPGHAMRHFAGPQTTATTSLGSRIVLREQKLGRLVHIN